jgi:hypothetical protein
MFHIGFITELMGGVAEQVDGGPGILFVLRYNDRDIEQDGIPGFGPTQQIIGRYRLVAPGHGDHRTIGVTFQTARAGFAVKEFVATATQHFLSPKAQDTLGCGIPEDDVLRLVKSVYAIGGMLQDAQHLVHRHSSLLCVRHALAFRQVRY